MIKVVGTICSLSLKKSKQHLEVLNKKLKIYPEIDNGVFYHRAKLQLKIPCIWGREK
jgi:hypothetical protein